MKKFLFVMVMIAVLLPIVVHSRRRSDGVKGRRRSSRLRERASNLWQAQQVIGHDQQDQQTQWDLDPWTPQQVVPDNTQGKPWTPQIIQPPRREQPWGGGVGDAWLPETVQQETELEYGVQFPIAGDCHFDYDEVPADHHHPFLVDRNNQAFLYPDWVGRVRVVDMADGKTVLAACPGEGNSLIISGRTYMYLKCQRGTLIYRRRPITWGEIGCVKKPNPTLQRGGICGHGDTVGETRVIGWQINRRLYIPQITLCFNQEQETARFSAHKIYGRYIDAKEIDSSRPGFRSARMFSVSPAKSYAKSSQRNLLQGLLNTTQHLTGRGQHYLAKGHLAPDADFVLEAEQDATYYYANAVPQWQAVNNGNWKKLEFAVREVSETRRWPLDVWTGTHGTLQLPDLRNNPVDLFLGLTLGREVVPVPALLWKVIHDPVSHTAVAIVMVNDVRGLGTSGSWRLSQPLCPDMCPQLPWVDWRTSNVRRGITFCCTVDALRATISDIPILGHTDLLRN